MSDTSGRATWHDASLTEKVHAIVLAALIWVTLKLHWSRSDSSMNSEKAEAARERSSEIDDWSEVVDRER